MPNPFFSALGGPSLGGMNILTMLPQLKQNPLGMLRQAGFNVPGNVNNPQSIIQHLMNSGQISQQQMNQAQQLTQQLAQQFGLR